jgi:hypothetical protein
MSASKPVEGQGGPGKGPGPPVCWMRSTSIQCHRARDQSIHCVCSISPLFRVFLQKVLVFSTAINRVADEVISYVCVLIHRPKLHVADCVGNVPRPVKKGFTSKLLAVPKVRHLLQILGFIRPG